MTHDTTPAQDIVLIGATGDLARRKLLPALWNLYLDGLLSPRGGIIGFARGEGGDDQFRQMARDAIEAYSRRPPDPARWEAFAGRLSYCSGQREGYSGLRRRLTIEEQLIYLAVPPGATVHVLDELRAAGIATARARIVVEKPFGTDLASARELTAALLRCFEERQVFRIDHYLGKETVQNILVFRFGNAVFERVWNRDAIDHVQFTVAESIGIEGRGAFYEQTGALRDILQNHVFQVLSLLAMEAPASFEAEALRDERHKLFMAMRPLAPEDVVRGQYVRAGGVPGYREEAGVDPASGVETFAAARLFIDNWRWAGVPFFLRTGKRLPERRTQVAVQFKGVPVPFFRSAGVAALEPNRLILDIQPEECIRFQFVAKAPGVDLRVEPVEMQFAYGESFVTQPAEAYERLIHDALRGDQSLFARSDSVERAWEVVEPIICCDPTPLHQYPAGSWGPVAADALIAPRRWMLR